MSGYTGNINIKQLLESSDMNILVVLGGLEDRDDGGYLALHSSLE